jgi:hypothetical protein
MKTLKLTLLFVIGGVVYPLMEVGWRGFSHYSMSIAGGASLIGLYFISKNAGKAGLALKSLMGAIMITCIELVTGLIVNVGFDLRVWDYSRLPMNFMGQICFPFFMVWYMTSACTISVIVLIGDIKSRLVKPENEPIPEDKSSMRDSAAREPLQKKKTA